MQVMNGGEFEEKSVLIGRTGETKGFGVSDDPMLMSMLSTGLYANPLRTMLQEIMFNAWDAHRMGNCQDRPIDVYLNDTSGLIVRDYGPGIAPEDIHPIYCIYGNSTKRDDKGQTGGFGLGSKSPFAYNDSFSVTSHYQGKKSMYVINRASEENNGGPGLTPIIQDVPTEESGLVVTVPIKSDRDMQRAYNYIKDVLYLSGIMVNIHYEDREVEHIHSETVPAGQWVTSEDEQGIWAVYGGVRYKIEQDDAYREEYRFIKNLARIVGGFYIGFAPDTLTPLPNREGLNLSERCVESIKTQLETIQENFMVAIKPACRMAMEATIKKLVESGIQKQFLAYRWTQAGSTSLSSIAANAAVLTAEPDKKPEGVSEEIWTSMVMLAYRNTSAMAELIGYDTFNKMRGIVFVKQFPEYRKHLNYLTDGSYHRGRFDPEFEESGFPNWVKKTNEILHQLNEITEQNINLRMLFSHNSVWTIVSSLRGGNKIQKRGRNWRAEEAIKKQLSLGKLKTPKHPSLYRLWSHSDGHEIKTMMMDNIIVVAKTATALNETSFKFEKYFCPANNEKEDLYTYSNSFSSSYFHSGKFRYSNRVGYVPAIVVHRKKDGYDKAVAFLKDQGYTVIEADEPVKKTLTKDKNTDVKSVKKGPPTFPVAMPDRHNWVDYSLPEIDNPQCYFCCTLSAIEDYNRYSKPDKSILKAVVKKWPRTVILHNKQRKPVIDRKGVPTMAAKIDNEINRLFKNEERIRKMYLHLYVKESSSLPNEIMAIPEMQKLMGIPYLRTAQIESFEKDWRLIQAIMNKGRNQNKEYLWPETYTKVLEKMESYDEDPALSLVREMCAKTHLFDANALRRQVSGMKRGEQKILSQKIARFLRTV